MALVKPVNYPVEQPFDGTFEWERPGYIQYSNPKRGRRTSFTNSVYRNHLHLATDYACPDGTPVKAMHDGKIIQQGYDPYSGNAWFIQLEVRVGLIFKIHLLFYHLTPHSLKFRTGDRVKANDIIALSGHSGWATGPHLHVEMVRGIRGSSYLNWYKWLRFDIQPFVDGMNLDKIAP